MGEPAWGHHCAWAPWGSQPHAPACPSTRSSRMSLHMHVPGRMRTRQKQSADGAQGCKHSRACSGCPEQWPGTQLFLSANRPFPVDEGEEELPARTGLAAWTWSCSLGSGTDHAKSPALIKANLRAVQTSKPIDSPSSLLQGHHTNHGSHKTRAQARGTTGNSLGKASPQGGEGRSSSSHVPEGTALLFLLCHTQGQGLV